MRGGVDQAPRKGGGEQVAEGVTLLQEAGHQAAGGGGKVFEGGGGGVAVETAHGDAEEGAAGEELGVGLGEAGALEVLRLASDHCARVQF